MRLHFFIIPIGPTTSSNALHWIVAAFLALDHGTGLGRELELELAVKWAPSPLTSSGNSFRATGSCSTPLQSS